MCRRDLLKHFVRGGRPEPVLSLGLVTIVLQIRRRASASERFAASANTALHQRHDLCGSASPNCARTSSMLRRVAALIVLLVVQHS